MPDERNLEFAKMLEKFTPEEQAKINYLTEKLAEGLTQSIENQKKIQSKIVQMNSILDMNTDSLKERHPKNEQVIRNNIFTYKNELAALDKLLKSTSEQELIADEKQLSDIASDSKTTIYLDGDYVKVYKKVYKNFFAFLVYFSSF